MKILKSVKFKLLFIALLAVLLSNLVVIFSDMHVTGKLLVRGEQEAVVRMSDIIEKSIVILMMENRWGELQTLMENLPNENRHLAEVRIFQPVSGRIIVAADRDEVGRNIYEKDWDKYKKRDYSPFLIEKDGRYLAGRIAPIRNRPACHGCHKPDQEVLGVIDVKVSLAGIEKSVGDLLYQHTISIAFGFLVISIVFFIVGGRIINKPLGDLMGAMKKVESGDLSVRAGETGKDEFGYLSRGFNTMVTSLEAAKKEVESCHIEQIEKTAKLASLGELISGIAHEIKNPLTAISCGIQVLHSSVDGDDRRKTIVQILDHVNRLDRIVKDVLDYAKPKPLRVVRTRVGDVLEKALFLALPEAKKQNIAIEREIGGDIPEIMVDPDQIQQVFLNLIINALQSMPAGGSLRISARKAGGARCEVRGTEREILEPPTSNLQPPADFIEISVADTGNGIAPEDLERVFEPFFTKKTKGSGLGLSISQKIVQEHGGEINVKSEVGKGSVFGVYLPLSKGTS